MIKELKIKVKFDFLEERKSLSIYVEMHHGEIINSSYDKAQLEEYMLENKKRFFYIKGEKEETKKELKKIENKIKENVNELYRKEVEDFRKKIEQSLSKLGQKGKNFLFQIEDRNNIK